MFCCHNASFQYLCEEMRFVSLFFLLLPAFNFLYSSYVLFIQWLYQCTYTLSLGFAKHNLGTARESFLQTIKRHLLPVSGLCIYEVIWFSGLDFYSRFCVRSCEWNSIKWVFGTLFWVSLSLSLSKEDGSHHFRVSHDLSNGLDLIWIQTKMWNLSSMVQKFCREKSSGCKKTNWAKPSSMDQQSCRKKKSSGRQNKTKQKKARGDRGRESSASWVQSVRFW